MPKASTIAVFINPSNPNAEIQSRDAQAAVRAIGAQILILNVSSQIGFEAAFKSLIQQRADALLVGNDPFLINRREEIVALAARYAVPAIYQFHEFVVAGGLISYGSSIAGVYRQAGLYIGRILKGAKLADLPVIQLTKFELVINLKTAKALGIEVPPQLLARADEVIE